MSPAERTVAEKLQVTAGDIVGVTGDVELIGPLPNGASFSAEFAGVDVALVFVESRSDLLDRFATLLPQLAGARAVWFCYRKANAVDLNRDTIIRESGDFGWRPNSNVAIDSVWSAVRVRPLATGEAAMA
jgi:hypothetical protein